MLVITCQQAYRDLIHRRVQHKGETKLGANASVDRTASRDSGRLELVFLFLIQNNGGEPKNTVVYTQIAFKSKKEGKGKIKNETPIP